MLEHGRLAAAVRDHADYAAVMPLPGQHHAGAVGARPGRARAMPDRISHQFRGDDYRLLDHGFLPPGAQRRRREVTRRLDRLRSGNQQELTMPVVGQVEQISTLSRVLPGHCALLHSGRPTQIANRPQLTAAISQVPGLRGSHCVVSLMHECELKRVWAKSFRACSSVTMPLIGVHLQVPSHTRVGSVRGCSYRYDGIGTCICTCRCTAWPEESLGPGDKAGPD